MSVQSLTVGCLLLLLLENAAVAGKPRDALEVAQANAAAIRLIHSLMVSVRETIELYTATGIELSPNELEFSWTWQGERQRLVCRERGKHRRFSDQLQGPQGYKALIHDDSDQPPAGDKISLHAFGQLGPPRAGPLLFDFNPRVRLLLEIPDRNKDTIEFRSLLELVRNAVSARLVKTPDTSSRKCYELEIKQAEVEYLIHVDPQANYMMRRIEAHATRLSTDRGQSYFEVESYHDGGGGVFLPKRVQGKSTDNFTKGIALDCQILSVNEPLPDKAFDLSFPPGLEVIDLATGQVSIWGESGPRQTFASDQEYRAWLEQREISLRRLRYGNAVLVFANLVVGWLLILEGYRRRKARR